VEKIRRKIMENPEIKYLNIDDQVNLDLSVFDTTIFEKNIGDNQILEIFKKSLSPDYIDLLFSSYKEIQYELNNENSLTKTGNLKKSSIEKLTTDLRQKIESIEESKHKKKPQKKEELIEKSVEDIKDEFIDSGICHLCGESKDNVSAGLGTCYDCELKDEKKKTELKKRKKDLTSYLTTPVQLDNTEIKVPKSDMKETEQNDFFEKDFLEKEKILESEMLLTEDQNIKPKETELEDVKDDFYDKTLLEREYIIEKEMLSIGNNNDDKEDEKKINKKDEESKGKWFLDDLYK
jgi:hypothetical protein